MKDIIDLIARVCISLIFLFEAYDTIKYFKTTKKIMTEYGVTWNQEFLLIGAIFLMIVGGVLILSGYRSSLGGVLLIMFYLPVTLIAHSWWNDPIDMQREQSILFMKNIAIIGGLLIIVVNGSGKYSIKRLFATTKVSERF